MSLTSAHIATFKTQVLAAMDALLRPHTVTLSEGGTYTVASSITTRATGAVMTSSRSSGLTDGLNQDKMVCVLSYDSWHESIPANRPPRKGDIVTDAMGVKRAIERVVPASAGEVIMFYKAELLG